MDSIQDKENIYPVSARQRNYPVSRPENSNGSKCSRKFGKELFSGACSILKCGGKDESTKPCASSDIGFKTVDTHRANVPPLYSTKLLSHKAIPENNQAIFSSAIDGKSFGTPKSPELSSEFSINFRDNAKYQSANKTTSKFESGYQSALMTSGIKCFESTPSSQERNMVPQEVGSILCDGKNRTVPRGLMKAVSSSNLPSSEVKQTLRYCQSTPDCKQGCRISESRPSSLLSNRFASRMCELKSIAAPIPRWQPIRGKDLKLMLDFDEAAEEQISEEDQPVEPTKSGRAEACLATISEEVSVSSNSPDNYSRSIPPRVNNKTVEDCNKRNENGFDLNCNQDLNRRNSSRHEVGVGSPQTETKSQYVQTESTESTIVVNGIPYTIMSQIGQGASSKVFEGRCGNKNVVVAIKQVFLANADKSVHESYVNEINLLKKLKGSDRVITLYDAEFHPGNRVFHIVMEKGELDLQTLIRNIAKNGKLKDYELQYFWMQMLEAVQVVHGAGIIHSDLKAANFVLAKGQLKLIDFGIASSIQSDDVTSVIKDSIAGTFNYMAPESLTRIEVNHSDTSAICKDEKAYVKISRRTDVWSLGCILYALTYGKTPFQHISTYAKCYAIGDQSHLIDYPPANKNVVAVIKKCLIRDPMQRSSIDELLNSSSFCSQCGGSINYKCQNVNEKT